MYLKQSAIFASLSILFLYLNLTPIVSILRGGVFVVLSPISYILINIQSEALVSKNIFTKGMSLVEENKKLKEQLIKTESILVAIDEKKSSQQFLSEQQQYVVNKGSVVTAFVIGQSNTNTGLFLTINKGEKSGVVEGSSVFIDGYLIGLVQSTTLSTATVKTLNQQNISIPARVAGSDTSGLYICQNFDCKFDKVLNSSELRIDDLVVTSGVGGNYSEGFIIGRVKTINQQDEQVFKSATLYNLVDYLTINRLSVLIKNAN